jgi:hypothetical protein
MVGDARRDAKDDARTARNGDGRCGPLRQSRHHRRVGTTGFTVLYVAFAFDVVDVGNDDVFDEHDMRCYMRAQVAEEKVLDQVHQARQCAAGCSGESRGQAIKLKSLGKVMPRQRPPPYIAAGDTQDSPDVLAWPRGQEAEGDLKFSTNRHLHALDGR